MGGNICLVPVKCKFYDENRYNGVYGKSYVTYIFDARSSTLPRPALQIRAFILQTNTNGVNCNRAQSTKNPTFFH